MARSTGNAIRSAACPVRAAAEAVGEALDGGEHLVGGRFSVADVLVGSAVLFTTRARITEDVPPSLLEYVGRLGQRPAFQRALERTLSRTCARAYVRLSAATRP
jgi:glutathione S-transferase